MTMPCVKPEEKDKARCQAITEIISSVAQEQSALSKIINAEAEKIEKIVMCAEGTEQILAVNNSVEKMLSSITRLELVLQSKLELFDDCLCEECKEKPKFEC